MPQPTSVTSHAVLRHTLLTLVVLAGILAMHGVSPASITDGHPMSAGMAEVRHAEVVDATAPCQDTKGAGGCGHLTHADSTCAAPWVEDNPQLPCTATDPIGSPVGTPSAKHRSTPTTVGRSPPSLAELQLLRI